MHVRGIFFKYFYIVVFVLLVGGVCLFNTFRQGQKLHAFFPRRCVLGFSIFSPPLSCFIFVYFGGGSGV